jgi:hypothetical protein
MCRAQSRAPESRQVCGEMAEAQRSVIPCIRDRLFSSWRIRGALALVAAYFVATTSDDARPVPRASLRPRLAAPSYRCDKCRDSRVFPPYTGSQPGWPSRAAIAHGLNTNVVCKWHAGRGFKRMGDAVPATNDIARTLQIVLSSCRGLSP